MVGADAFGVLLDAVQDCTGSGASTETSPLQATIRVWVGLHGLATLQASLPWFPWPPTYRVPGRSTHPGGRRGVVIPRPHPPAAITAARTLTGVGDRGSPAASRSRVGSDGEPVHHALGGQRRCTETLTGPATRVNCRVPASSTAVSGLGRPADPAPPPSPPASRAIQALCPARHVNSPIHPRLTPSDASL